MCYYYIGAARLTSMPQLEPTVTLWLPIQVASTFCIACIAKRFALNCISILLYCHVKNLHTTTISRYKKHLAIKFNFMTNSNPQSIVIILCMLWLQIYNKDLFPGYI